GRADPDVGAELHRILSDEGVEILTKVRATAVHGVSGDQVRIVVDTESGSKEIEGSDLLVSVGRIPNTTDLGLGETGVEVDTLGYIRVNERLETSAPGRRAIGEC